ncbi:hypothetical protein C4D60_Mb08t04570 [Musa balbisiana]|uniref:KNOX1 domain-containing protein n=1 Tax=Musa balbisiana TaxID=52838 RepID=A0A4S8K1F7_MUSBA|nr:hypothetical protein C4D60_Mb08t04570 [Musa balbisiana]
MLGNGGVSQPGGNPCGGLLCTSSSTARQSSTVVAAADAMVATPSAAYCNLIDPFLISDHHEIPNLLQPKPQGASTSQIPQGDDHAIKAKIISHSQCSSLVSAYVECQKEHIISMVRASSHRFLLPTVLSSRACRWEHHQK